MCITKNCLCCISQKHSIPQEVTGLQPGWTRKDIQHLPRFLCALQKTVYAVYPRSTQSHKRWQDFNLDEPERIYNICLDTHVHYKNLFMLYNPEALSHTRGDRTGWTRKDIQHLPRFSCALQKKLFKWYIPKALRYAEMTGLQRGLDKPERITFA